MRRRRFTAYSCRRLADQPASRTTQMKIGIRTALAMVFVLLAGAHWVGAESTVFTYQGNLQNGGTAANGIYDLTFGIYTNVAGGSPIGTVLQNSNVGFTNGLFTASLDFGNVFDGTPCWLEIGVRVHGGA